MDEVIFILLWGIGIISKVHAGTIQKIHISDDQPAIKGVSLQLACHISQFTDKDAVHLYRTDSQHLSGPLPLSLTACIPTFCLTHTIGRYSFSADTSNLYVNITDLNRSEDQKWWTCVLGLQRKDMYLTIYTIPQKLQFDSQPNQDQDIAENAVTISCSTGCAYPQPTFTWFYTESGGFRQEWSASGSVTNRAGECTDSERIYTSTLSLARYTTFPGNVEKTVKFVCGITSFTGMTQPLYSNSSISVQFAVRVATVSLEVDGTAPNSTDTVETISGVQKTFKCAASISRPPATIVWYIRNTVKQRSTSTEYIYTPDYADNNKQIYCKAFNIQSESNAISSNKPVLKVNVKVTSVILFDGSSTPGNDDDIVVTENQDKTLTCRTGESIPVSTIVWYINGQMKQTGTQISFVFTPTNIDHSKNIYCKAYNIQPPPEAVMSTSPKLYVRVLARRPLLTNWTAGNPFFLSGEEVTLNCQSTPTRPAVLVVWKKGTTTLGVVQNIENTNSEGLVTVMSKVTFTPKRNDNGTTVSCESSIKNQTPQKVQHIIIIWWPPSTPFIPINSFPWIEGQSEKQLKCESSDYGNPVANVLWIPSIGTAAGSILSLPTLTKYYHAVNVTCKLENDYTDRLNRTVKSQTVLLDIQYKPEIVIHIDGVEKYSIVRNEGQSFTAVCSAKGNPVPSVIWQGQNSVNASNKLEFTDIDRQDHGGYRCTAKASSVDYPSYDFSNETTLHVTVNYAPNVTVGLSNTDPTENGSLRISCNAVGRPEDYSYTSIVHTWNSVEINKYRQGGGVIHMINVQLEDSGIYTCLVNNGVRDRNQRLDQIGMRNVMIKVSPKVLLEGTNTFVGVTGKSVTITIPFYCYPEIRTLMFKLPNGTVIANSSKYEIRYWQQNVSTKFYGQSVQLKGYNAVLRIKDEELSDFTNYTLNLKNDIGPQTEWILRHVQESKPSVPVKFTYTGLTDGVPTFSFVGGFNGGRMQTFIVETAVLGTGNWKEQIRFNETDKQFLKDDKFTFRFNLTKLEPNMFDVRILSRNSIGRIDEKYAPTLRFEMKKPEDETHQSPVAAVAGGSGAALAIIAIAVVFLVVFIRKRRVQNKDERSNEQKLEERPNVETSYCDLTSPDDSHQYSRVDSETTFQYETLQEASKGKKVTDTYEELQVRDNENPPESAVIESSPVSTVTTDKVYENLKL